MTTLEVFTLFVVFCLIPTVTWVVAYHVGYKNCYDAMKKRKKGPQ